MNITPLQMAIIAPILFVLVVVFWVTHRVFEYKRLKSPLYERLIAIFLIALFVLPFAYVYGFNELAQPTFFEVLYYGSPIVITAIWFWIVAPRLRMRAEQQEDERLKRIVAFVTAVLLSLFLAYGAYGLMFISQVII